MTENSRKCKASLTLTLIHQFMQNHCPLAVDAQFNLLYFRHHEDVHQPCTEATKNAKIVYVETYASLSLNKLEDKLHQWLLNLLEVPNPASLMRAFTESFVKIQNISVNKLEPKVNYASVAHKIFE